MAGNSFMGFQGTSIKLTVRKVHDFFMHSILNFQQTANLLLLNNLLEERVRQAPFGGVNGLDSRRKLVMVTGKNNFVRS